jgi:ankyrin repeat protein
VKFFIDKGIDMELMDKNELSALSHAIQEKNLVAVKLLVERGAKIHGMPDGSIQRTALSYAAKYGSLEMLQFLLPLLPEVGSVSFCSQLCWALFPIVSNLLLTIQFCSTG